MGRECWRRRIMGEEVLRRWDDRSIDVWRGKRRYE